MKSETNHAELIRTKLYAPRVTIDRVQVDRNLDALMRDLDRPFTLVSAAAGFGKTTLLSNWLSSNPRPSAWLSLDENDSDVQLFLRYFCSAIRTLFPDACTDTLMLLQGSNIPPLQRLSATLVNDIDNIPNDVTNANRLPDGQRFILVLDDYHLIENQDIHHLVGVLMHHPPPSLHLVISSRRDPPLALARLRAHGELLEIRTGALRFNDEEVARFLSLAVPYPLDDQTIAFVAKRTEGWAAGLRFAALTLNATHNTDAPLQIPLGKSEWMEYLLTEVLANLPASTLKFVVETAILDKLNASLCIAAIGDDDSEQEGQQILEWLEEKNIFTIALDDAGKWYRYHHLFRELLQSQLERRYAPQEIAAMHVRASLWFEAAGLVEEAIRHALAANDMVRAARLVEIHGHAADIFRNTAVMKRWLGMLPRSLIEMHPTLMLLETWLLERQARYTEMVTHLNRIERMIEKLPPSHPELVWLQSEIDMQRGRIAFSVSDAEDARALSARALESAPLSHSSLRIMARITLAGALQMLGDVRGMRDVMEEGLRESQYHDNTFLLMLVIKYAQLNLFAAEFGALQQNATQSLRLASEGDSPFGLAWAYYFLGCIAYQHNDLARAEETLVASVHRRYATTIFNFIQASLSLASTYLALGAYEKIPPLLDEVYAHGWEMHSDRVILLAAEAFQAYAALQMGENVKAWRWASECTGDIPLTPMAPYNEISLMLVRILLDEGTPESLARAGHLLDQMEGNSVAPNGKFFLIGAKALRALLNDANGNEAAALAALKDSIALAEPSGLLRVYLDMGPAMADLMQRWTQKESVPNLVKKVLTAFSAEPVFHVNISGSDLPMSSPFARLDAHAGVIDGLTRRESEILALLGMDLTAHEIARQLQISEHTVKRHRANIYQKLQVNRRRDALAIARRAGLFDASLLLS